MNLYQIGFEHYSQKDSRIGILTYLVTDSNEDVYEWLKSNPQLKSRENIYTTYQDNENDGKSFEVYDENFNVIGKESFRDSIIESQGCMNNEYILDGLSDLYYGATLYGWKLIKENMNISEIEQLERIGISLEKS